LQRALIHISRHVKGIKIHQDFPKLLSEMYFHIFMVHSVCASSIVVSYVTLTQRKH